MASEEALEERRRKAREDTGTQMNKTAAEAKARFKAEIEAKRALKRAQRAEIDQQPATNTNVRPHEIKNEPERETTAISSHLTERTASAVNPSAAPGDVPQTKQPLSREAPAQAQVKDEFTSREHPLAARADGLARRGSIGYQIRGAAKQKDVPADSARHSSTPSTTAQGGKGKAPSRDPAGSTSAAPAKRPSQSSVYGSGRDMSSLKVSKRASVASPQPATEEPAGDAEQQSSTAIGRPPQWYKITPRPNTRGKNDADVDPLLQRLRDGIGNCKKTEEWPEQRNRLHDLHTLRTVLHKIMTTDAVGLCEYLTKVKPLFLYIDKANKMASRSSSKRKALNQLDDILEQLSAPVDDIQRTYDNASLDPEKENIDPATEAIISPQTAHALFKKARRTTQMASNTRASVEQRFEELEKRVSNLEGSVNAFSSWQIIVGEAQMIDDWVDKMVDAKTNNGMPSGWQHQDLAPAEVNQDVAASYSSSDRTDRFVQKKTKRFFKEFVEERGLTKFGFGEKFDILTNTTRRKARNDAVHETQFMVYAHAMVEAAKRDISIMDKMAEYAQIFEWTYGMSWGQAAKHPVLLGDEGNSTSQS
ncbi:uncharacterized protein LTR77_004149 [Saxophila tyrrhenica]|uniref:Uncharacterized protein n=1 Tax=Saxophila tyrrhenica TaxID=1690608 RepID=A0AAV9PG65_9PEZI|nr:hypothetical protein LTR77_004149 [Saxophila tyrrhenica]